MSRIGLGRHGHAADAAGDPLDGLVNLFDLGLVLAVAFLVAGLAAGRQAAERDTAQGSAPTSATTPGQRVELPRQGGSARGAGAEVGTVYRLSDGTLVLKNR